MSNPSYYAVIPATVRYCQTVPDGAKLLFGEITALTNKEGYCWASNAYFSNLYGKSPDTISRWVSSLVKSGFIDIEIDKANGNERRIRLSEKMGTPIRKNTETYPQKYGYPIGKNAEYNNTENITINNNSERVKKQTTKKQNSLLRKPTNLSLTALQPLPLPDITPETNTPLPINSTVSQQQPFAAPDWIEVAKLMTDYAKGQGASQWEFMATAQGYRGEPERILSNWASKATPYQLINWKKEFPKIQTWMRNEALNDYKNKVTTPESAKKNITIL